VLPLTIALWYWRPDWLTFLTWFNGTLLLSVITAPFGWGYDAIVLLLPILQMAAWAVTGHLGRWNAGLLFLFLFIIDLLLLRLRLQEINEVYYVWLPAAVAVLYIGAQVNVKASERRW